MIRINLVPEEMATIDRTPTSLFLVIIGDIVFGMLAILAFIYFHFFAVNEAETRREQAAQDLQPLKQYAATHSQMTQLQTKYKSRNETITGLEEKRLSWSRKLFEFSAVLDGSGDEKHPVWIENWEPSLPQTAARPTVPAVPGMAAAGEPGFEIKMNLHVARPHGAPEERPIDHYLTAFRRDLSDAEKFAFWKDFKEISLPELKPDTQSSFEYFEEQEFGASKLQLTMKSLDWRHADKAPAAPTPPRRPGGGR